MPSLWRSTLKRGALTRILAVPERRLALERNGDAIGERLRSLACEPVSDRSVVRGRALRTLSRQQPPRSRSSSSASSDARHAPVVGGINDYCNRCEVLCRRPEHRRPTDVDLLDDFFRFGASSCGGFLERIEVTATKIYRRDVVLGERFHVFGNIAARQKRARGWPGAASSLFRRALREVSDSLTSAHLDTGGTHTFAVPPSR